MIETLVIGVEVGATQKMTYKQYIMCCHANKTVPRSPRKAYEEITIALAENQSRLLPDDIISGITALARSST